MRSGANGQRAHEVLFSGMDEGADDEAAEGGVGIGVSVGIAVGFLAVVGVFLLPLGTEFGGKFQLRVPMRDISWSKKCFALAARFIQSTPIVRSDT